MSTENATTRASHDYARNFPIRIAQVGAGVFEWGVRSVVLNYYKHIDRNVVQFDFFLSSQEAQELENTISDLGGRIFVVPVYYRKLPSYKVLYKHFLVNKYSIVHSHINTMSFVPLSAAYFAGVPVRIAHNHNTAGHDSFKNNVVKNLLRPISRVFPTHLCACSEYAGRWLFGNNAARSGKIKIWPNAIELSRFAYNEAVRQDMRHKLNLDGKFVVGHAGRFMTQKNHSFLIDVFAEIHRLRNNSVLLLCGSGPLMNDIKAKVHQLGLNDCVIFAGNVSDVERYYQAMDVFVFPSLYEGLPVVGSEVQVSGLPFLCADTVTSETKFCDNLHFLSLKKSPAEWAQEALSISEGHIRLDMSAYARNAGFDIHEQARKLTNWYCQLLGL